MRRFFLGLAISSLTASAPVVALGGDREIADNIISTLKSHQTDGSLKGFDIDLSVEDGLVTLSGTVSTEAQAVAVVEAAKTAVGVKAIDNTITVVDTSAETASAAKTASMLAFAAQSIADENVQQASGTEDALSVNNDETDLTSTLEPPKMVAREVSVSPADAAVTDAVLGKLGNDKSNGFLRNFDLDLSTVNGEVWVRGYVANARQKQHVLQTIQYTPGVSRVVDDIAVTGTITPGTITPGTITPGTITPDAVRPASNSQPIAPPAPPAPPAPLQSASMPVMGPVVSQGPRAFAPSMVANYQNDVPPSMPMGAPAGMMGGGQSPMPMNMGPSYGAGVPRYDQPQMPGYAWPSYAAYPNYAAVTYPKQYSASAWPYIGPFYPYPQVPLGWRRVALEWDDGLWYLDFTSK